MNSTVLVLVEQTPPLLMAVLMSLDALLSISKFKANIVHHSFQCFSLWRTNVVDAREESAQDHFRPSSLSVEV